MRLLVPLLEFNQHGLDWNPCLLLCVGIKARARFSLLLHQLAKVGQNEFAGLFGCFVSYSAERIEEYSSGLLIGLALLGQERVQVLFWSSLGVVYDSDIGRFQGNRTSPAPPSPVLIPPFTMFALAGILISFFRQCVAAADTSLLPLSRFPLAATCSAFAGIITTSDT